MWQVLDSWEDNGVLCLCVREWAWAVDSVRVRQAPLSEDQGRAPRRYGTQVGGIGSGFELAKTLARGPPLPRPSPFQRSHADELNRGIQWHDEGNTTDLRDNQ